MNSTAALLGSTLRYQRRLSAFPFTGAHGAERERERESLCVCSLFLTHSNDVAFKLVYLIVLQKSIPS